MPKNVIAMKQGILLALLPAMVGGCTSMRSTSGVNEKEMVTGIPYFLPKQMLSISGERPQTDFEKVFTGLGYAQAEHDLLSAKLKAATAKRDVAKVMLQANKDAGAALTTFQSELGKLDGEAQLLERQFSDAKTALEDAKKLKDDTLNPAAGEPCTYNFTLTRLDPVADHSQTYYLLPQHNFLRDDEVKLAFTPDGLLTNAETISVGRVSDIIAEFANSVGDVVAKTNSNDDDTDDTDDNYIDCNKLPDEFIIDFDPANTTSLNDANTALDAFGLRVNYAAAQDEAKGGTPEDIKARSSGIIYRSPGSAIITISNRSNAALLKTTVSLPQAGQLAMLPMKASPFVKTTNNLKFENGMLVAADSSRPSEALEIARLPGRAIGSLLDGFGKTLGALGGAIAGKQQISAAQLEAFTAEQKLLAATECVTNAKRDGLPTVTCFD
jgi:hypothetical protein